MSEPDVILDVGPEGVVSASGSAATRLLKVKLTLGPAIIEFEAMIAEMITVVTKLTVEFDKAQLFKESKKGEGV